VARSTIGTGHSRNGIMEDLVPSAATQWPGCNVDLPKRPISFAVNTGAAKMFRLRPWTSMLACPKGVTGRDQKPDVTLFGSTFVQVHSTVGWTRRESMDTSRAARGAKPGLHSGQRLFAILFIFSGRLTAIHLGSPPWDFESPSTEGNFPPTHGSHCPG
jgi:hypothetical protein